MDEITKKAVAAYRACLELPASVTDEQLAAEAKKIIKLVRQGDLKFAIAQGLTNSLLVAPYNKARFDGDCGKLADAIRKLVDVHRL